MVCPSVSLTTPNPPPDQNPWSTDSQAVVSVEPDVGSSAGAYSAYDGPPPSLLFFRSTQCLLPSPGADLGPTMSKPPWHNLVREFELFLHPPEVKRIPPLSSAYVLLLFTSCFSYYPIPYPFCQFLIILVMATNCSGLGDLGHNARNTR